MNPKEFEPFNIDGYHRATDNTLVHWEYKVRPLSRIFEKNFRPQLHHIKILDNFDGLTERKYAKEILEEILVNSGFKEKEKTPERKFW
jgi:hypothetical protein